MAVLTRRRSRVLNTHQSKFARPVSRTNYRLLVIQHSLTTKKQRAGTTVPTAPF